MFSLAGRDVPNGSDSAQLECFMSHSEECSAWSSMESTKGCVPCPTCLEAWRGTRGLISENPTGKKQKINKSCSAKALPGGLKMWRPALDGQGGRGNSWGIWRCELSIRKRTDQAKKIWRGSRPRSAVLKSAGLVEVENRVTVLLPPEIEVNLGCGGKREREQERDF